MDTAPPLPNHSSATSSIISPTAIPLSSSRPPSSIPDQNPTRVPLPSSHSPSASAHTSLVTVLSTDDPARVPLPSSPSSTGQQPSVSPSYTPSNTALDGKRELSYYFPHLSSIWSQTRHGGAGNITILDYSGHVFCGSEEISIAPAVGEEVIRQRLRGHTLRSNINTRLIIVEDISYRLISLLCMSFPLSPEFFEEHLHGSGFRRDLSAESLPRSWNTSNLRKSYVSLKWCRPVTRWRQEPITSFQVESLLSDGYLKGAYSKLIIDSQNKREVSKRILYTLRTMTNIFRPEFPLSIIPQNSNETHDAALRASSRWEERATTCTIEINHIRYVILLLDPMPLLRKNLRARDVALLPADEIDGRRQLESSNCKSRSSPIGVDDGDGIQEEIRSPFTQAKMRTPWTVDYSTLFSPLKTRKLDVCLDPFQSTKEAFIGWLVSATPDQIAKYPIRLGPASMIFRIVHEDTILLLGLMRSALADIASTSSGNVSEDQTLHWRYRLDRFRAYIVELEESLQQFVDFVHPVAEGQPQQTAVSLETRPIEYLFSDARAQILLTDRRLDQTYSVLLSKVQLMDSHRSIAEAETVTRLTEFAFLFIPLSFATSIFGMQIVDESTPVSTYIAVALGLTSVAYFLRFIIHWTTRRRMILVQKIRMKITASEYMPTGSHISTAMFFSWLLAPIRRERKLALFFATVLIPVVIPLPIIWTRELDTGIKIVMSCLLVLLPISHVFILFIKQMRGGKITNPFSRLEATDPDIDLE